MISQLWSDEKFENRWNLTEFTYSQVPNKRISIIKEYHEYFPVVVNEYHVINEYVWKAHDIHKRISPNKWIYYVKEKLMIFVD